MINQSATSYFHELSNLLLSTQVTDRHGATLSADEGVDRALDLILSLCTTLGKIMLIRQWWQCGDCQPHAKRPVQGSGGAGHGLQRTAAADRTVK